MINKLLAAAALALVAVSSQAAEPVSSQAAESPLYGGVDMGITRLDGAHTQTSYGTFLGYNLNKNFAVEANYRRLYSLDINGYGHKNDQLGLSVIGSLPVTDTLSVYGRVGVNRLTETWTGGGYKHTDHVTRAVPGIGVSYKLTEKVSARMEVQRPGMHLTNVSTGISYSF